MFVGLLIKLANFESKPEVNSQSCVFSCWQEVSHFIPKNGKMTRAENFRIKLSDCASSWPVLQADVGCMPEEMASFEGNQPPTLPQEEKEANVALLHCGSRSSHCRRLQGDKGSMGANHSCPDQPAATSCLLSNMALNLNYIFIFIYFTADQ